MIKQRQLLLPLIVLSTFILFLQTIEIVYGCEVRRVISWREHGISLGTVRLDVDMNISTSSPEDDNIPRALILDSKHNIYIGDSVNYRVLKFKKDGKFLSQFKLQKPVVEKNSKYGYNISALAVDQYDNLYVLNQQEIRIEVYDPNGKFLRSIYGVGGSPEYMYLDHEGNIYVYNPGLSAIYSPQGQSINISNVNNNAIGWEKKKLVGYSNYTLIVEEYGANSWLTLKSNGKRLNKCGPVKLEPTTKQYIDKYGNVYFFENGTLDIIGVRMREGQHWD